MFKADKVVTVINRCTDGATDTTVYSCHALAACSWYSTHGCRAERNGSAPGKTVKLRIPADAASGFDSDWILNGSSVLVLGAVQVENDAEFSAVCKQYETARVRAWHDHRDTVFPHIYVEGS